MPVAEAQPAYGLVGAAGLLFEGGCLAGGGVGQEADGGPALGLDLGEGGGDGGAYLGVDLADPAEPGHVLGGADGGEAPEGEQGDDRDHQQADDLRPDGGGPQPLPRPAGPAAAGATGRGGAGCGLRRFGGGGTGVGAAAARRGFGEP
ncbi:hypothetical protein [Streptomyces sp. C]|uniref:hypothetical protein n=1 Tax=Streptomyces sp. C TaxID=253839 RepID=UPI00321FCFE2